MIPSLLTKNMEQVALILRGNFLCRLLASVRYLRYRWRRCPTPPLGRDKSGPYGGGFASLAWQRGHFADGIGCVMVHACRHFLGWNPAWWRH